MHIIHDCTLPCCFIFPMRTLLDTWVYVETATEREEMTTEEAIPRVEVPTGRWYHCNCIVAEMEVI